MSAPSTNRQLREATDADLQLLLQQNRFVLVKFVDEDCKVCLELAPRMTAIANDPQYAHVLFLRIDSGENPVSAQTVSFHQAPFIVAYQDGQLRHCETVFTEKRVRDILDTFLMPEPEPERADAAR